jgi:uncharacterized membrane protein (DUF2068 family)
MVCGTVPVLLALTSKQRAACWSQEIARALTIGSLHRQLDISVMREHDLIESGPEVESTAVPASHHDSGLLMIGIFKMAKSIFFFGLGMGAIHLLHKDLADEVLKLASALRRDPEGRLVSFVLSKVDLIDVHRLRMISFGSFAYSALALVEGTGLLLEKAWAEYLTLTLTIMFLPWEVYELIRDANWMRVALLLINLAVLGYLVWLLQRKKSNTRAA